MINNIKIVLCNIIIFILSRRAFYREYPTYKMPIQVIAVFLFFIYFLINVPKNSGLIIPTWIYTVYKIVSISKRKEVIQWTLKKQ